MTDYPDARRRIPADARLATVEVRGWPLRSFDRDGGGRRGSILWLGGRGDVLEKYLECFEGWHRDGWHVTSFDWRGQGGSGRLLDDPHIGHIDDFGTWIADLAEFWERWTARTPAPHVVIGHSMGGQLVLRALVERRIAPAAAILSAPMLGFDSGALPAWLAPAAARAIGRWFNRRRAWRTNERPAAGQTSRATFLTTDAARYDDELWWRRQNPAHTLGPPSWGWMAAAFRSFAVVDAPGSLASVATAVLIVGTDGDQLVDPKAIRRVAAALPDAELLMFDETVAHEVLRERDDVRDQALARIDAFLTRHAPGPGKPPA